MDPIPAEDQSPEQGSPAHILLIVRPFFDARFYAHQYRDVGGDDESLLRHFCERGWQEGRCPHAGFDTVGYLDTYPDVAGIGWNPFYHYTLFGQVEGRRTTPASAPRSAAEALWDRDPGDCVAIIRPEVDEAFYAAQIGAAADCPFDLAAHFAYRGWRARLDPSARFSTAALLDSRPDLLGRHINPLLATLVERAALAPTVERAAHEPAPAAAAAQGPDDACANPWPDSDDPHLVTTRFPRSQLFGIGQALATLAAEFARRQPDAAVYADPVEQAVAAQVDRDYYAALYPDVGTSGVDPVSHYCQQGWLEGRNPCTWFDTAFYLHANPDVAAGGVNPFWHYLVEGRTEGRKPHRPGGYRRDIIERAMDPDARTRGWTQPQPVGLLTRSRLDRILRTASSVAKGLVVSLSHDCYVRVTGGIQLFIADEQARYARQGVTYLHLSPFQPLLRLADPQAPGTLLNMVLDGRFVGLTSYADLAETIAQLPDQPGEVRQFLVHCLLGHAVPETIAIQRALASRTNVFWVHDYSSICLGYTLLRNDVSYCHAPPADSMPCRVCVYGASRPQHLADMQALFGAVPFHVVAPSRAALAIWLAHANLPHLSATAHQHCDLVATDEPLVTRPPDAPVRVAFIGYARAHKGWPVWMELVSRARPLGAYEFIHLGSPETVEPGGFLRHHPVQTSAGHPDAMSDAVRDLDIDLVLVLSTWPETFSYVTFEALAGGADVVCLQDSGNVADTVLGRGRGLVAASEASLFDFFTSLRAVHYVRLCRQEGSAAGQLTRDGTTATLQLTRA